MHIIARFQPSARKAGGMARRLLEGRGEAVAVGEPDLAGDDRELVVRFADQPDGLLDPQMGQMVHRGSADLLQAEAPKVLEA